MDTNISEGGETYILIDSDVKTTLLTNIPIENLPIEQHDVPEQVLPHELALFSNSDGNLMISTVQQEENRPQW